MHLARAALALIATLVFIAPLRAQSAPQPVKLEMHGLVQVWALSEDSTSTFRIRRTELKLNGSFTEQLLWAVQIDPTRSSNLLQDAILTYVLRPDFLVDIGQYKVPFTREGIMSSSQLETVERALFASGPNKLADVRDIGAQIRYSSPWHSDFRFGVFNSLGGNDNAADRQPGKALMGLVTVSPPFAPGLGLTASGGITVGASDSAQASNRFSAGGWYGGKRFTVRSEYLSGDEAGIDREGYYGVLAYRIVPRLDVVGRYDVWKRDFDSPAATASVEETDYTAGLTYFIDGHRAKLQLNYIRKTFDDASQAASNVIIFNAQAAW